MPTKTIFTILSLGLNSVVFIPYYVSTFKKVTKPHFFSWLTWGILTGIGFILSLKAGGGGGSWIFAFQSILNLGVAACALAKGEKNIVFIDWIFFGGAIFTIFVYLFTKNAVLSVILAATIDMLGFLPTFRKSYSKPYNEPAFIYFFWSISFLFSIGALETYSFVTLFYPLAVAVACMTLVLFLLIRRKSAGLAPTETRYF